MLQLTFMFPYFDYTPLCCTTQMAEVFSVVSVRTSHSVRYFPRVFFLYFCIFHFYFFSFPFGFSYVALFTAVLFLQHSFLFCWNNYEVPALTEGAVSAIRPRATSGAIPWAPTGRPPVLSTDREPVESGPHNSSPLSSQVELSRRIQRQLMANMVPIATVADPGSTPVSSSPDDSDASDVPRSPNRNSRLRSPWNRFLGARTGASGTTQQRGREQYLERSDDPAPGQSGQSVAVDPANSELGQGHGRDSGWDEYVPLDSDEGGRFQRESILNVNHSRRSVGQDHGSIGVSVSDSSSSIRGEDTGQPDGRTTNPPSNFSSRQNFVYGEYQEEDSGSSMLFG